jgi:excalibur calcium-binding domain-containing protein
MTRAALLIVASIGAILIGAAPAASADPQPYANCAAAAKAGAYNIPSDSPYYGPWLDRDNDGIGCEKK